MGKHHKRKPRRNPAVTFVAGATLTAVAAVGVEVLTAGFAHADVDWSPVIACESGGNAQAQNPSSTASGLFQFLDTSWRAYGGGKYAARAKDATVAEQYEIANHAYAMSGLNPWAASRGCWSGKVNTSAPVAKTAPKPAAPGTVTTYRVQTGDTLARIAHRFGTPGGWEAIAAANMGSVSDPNMIYPGQTLKVPA